MNTGFDHRSLGTPEQAWRSGPLTGLPAVAVSAARLVVLAAHPDDETLGAGGLIAASHLAGADIVVVVASDGEASHPRSPTRSRGELAQLRRREVSAAITRLAPTATLRFLGLPDGELTRHQAEIETALTGVAGGVGVRLVTPWTGDRHPDHQACADAAARLASTRSTSGSRIEHWQYPIWLWHWGVPAPDALPARLCRLDIEAPVSEAKRAALAEHVSQHTALSPAVGDEPILAPEMIAHFQRPFECFVVDPAPASKAGYFEDLYAQSADPWGLGDRFYEQRKRDLLMASLPRRRFRRAFEPGCATGLITEQLLSRADGVVAWDANASAVRQTAERCARDVSAQAQIEHRAIPDDWPAGDFDLIVLSEVGYYCPDLDLLVRRVLGSLTPDGILLACHWARPAGDHPHSADAVHTALARALHRDVRHVEIDFYLDVFSRDGYSVAAAEHIV